MTTSSSNLKPSSFYENMFSDDGMEKMKNKAPICVNAIYRD
jgi:hypothetical protein